MFELPKLSYDLNALEPFMSKETLELHHSKHHQTYVTNLNNLLENSPLKGKSLEEIVKHSHKENMAPVFNNAGQHYNHIEFWKSLKVSKDADLPAKLKALVEKNFGSVASFKEEFVKQGTSVFGSGWVWLSQDGDKLEIKGYANAGSPLIDNKNPLLGCDVWEHSYYVDYRNRRPDYLKSFVNNLVNWDYVESRLK